MNDLLGRLLLLLGLCNNVPEVFHLSHNKTTAFQTKDLPLPRAQSKWSIKVDKNVQIFTKILQ